MFASQSIPGKTARGSRYLHLGLGWIGDRGGGLERYQHGLCAAHSDLGCQVSAWVQCRENVKLHSNFTVLPYASPIEKRTAKLAKLRAFAEVRFKNPDFTFVSHHASVSRSLVDLAKVVPHIVHFHGPWADESSYEGAPWWKAALQRREERLAYQSADRIITLSQVFKDLIVSRYNVKPEMVHVIPGGIDCDSSDPNLSRIDAREKLAWPRSRPIVLAVRRLVRRVGVDVLLDAVRQLVGDNRKEDLLVLIGGTGPMAGELGSKIRSYGIERNVQLLGYIPDDSLSLAYRAADLSIVPTQSLEGFGLITLESMAAGTPVLVTPVGSLPEVVANLSSSLVLSGHSSDDICQGLRAFTKGRLHLPSEGECRNYVRTRFDWSVIAPRVLDVYDMRV